jgi:WD40 repeat protein
MLPVSRPHYDDSNVFRYVLSICDSISVTPLPAVSSLLCDGTSIDDANFKGSGISLSGKVRGLRFPSEAMGFGSSSVLQCPDLTAIYSMHFHPNYRNLLLAAGKGRYVCVFDAAISSHITRYVGTDTSGDDGSAARHGNQKTLLSFKAHDRWISSARFIPLSTHPEPLLTSKSRSLNEESIMTSVCIPVVTASDDALLKEWDIGKQQWTRDVARPRLLCQSSDIHSRGIFAMDISSSYSSGCPHHILTGSKDRTVALSELDGGSGTCTGSGTGTGTGTGDIVCIRRFADMHSNVVKCVAWQLDGGADECIRRSNVFASGGTDRVVCVKDIQSASNHSDLKLQDVHLGGVHAVVFNPFRGAEHLLATAGLDEWLNVFDIRSVSSAGRPLFQFSGHAANHVRKFKTIYSSRFLSSDVIAMPGEDSSLLSLYDVSTGRSISRGELPLAPMMLATSFGQPSSGVGSADGEVDVSRDVSEDVSAGRGVYDDAVVAIACKGGAIFPLQLL